LENLFGPNPNELVGDGTFHSRYPEGMVAPPTSLARGISELCRANVSSFVLRRELRAHLARVVSFDAYCISAIDPVAGIVQSSVGDGLATRDAQKVFAIEERGDDYTAFSTLARPATIHAATGGDVARSERMRDVFLPLGLGDELRMPLAVDGVRWGLLHLFRARGRVFGAPEIARLAALEQEIARALRHAHVGPSPGAAGGGGPAVAQAGG